MSKFLEHCTHILDFSWWIVNWSVARKKLCLGTREPLTQGSMKKCTRQKSIVMLRSSSQKLLCMAMDFIFEMPSLNILWPMFWAQMAFYLTSQGPKFKSYSETITEKFYLFFLTFCFLKCTFFVNGNGCSSTFRVSNGLFKREKKLY